MITASTYTAKGFAHHQMQPATRQNPRYVSREAIEAFETSTPALKGISSEMIARGIWVVIDDSDAKSETASARGGAIASDERGTFYASGIYAGRIY